MKHNWLCCKESSFLLINILKDNYIQNDRSGYRDILLNCLEKIYSKYIVVKRGGIFDVSEIHAVKELKEIRDMNENIF